MQRCCGLALGFVFKGERAAADDALELLEWYKRDLTDKLLTRGDEPLFAKPTKPSALCDRIAFEDLGLAHYDMGRDPAESDLTGQLLL